MEYTIEEFKKALELLKSDREDLNDYGKGRLEMAEGVENLILFGVIRQSEQLKDRNDLLSELATDFLKEVMLKIPNIQLPEDENLYMALHRLRGEIKDNL